MNTEERQAFQESINRMRYSSEQTFAELDAMIDDGSATEDDFEPDRFNRRRAIWALRFRCSDEGDVLREAHDRMAAAGRDAE